MDTQLITFAVLILGGIALIAAIILHFVSHVFKVVEDPLIAEIADVLPGANCGGCGFAGCRNLAEEIVKTKVLEGVKCPAGGNAVLESIAKLLHLEASVSDPMTAVVKCNGSCEHAPAKSLYDGAPSCSYAASLFAGESSCTFGCLGLGDCVTVCQFDAIYINTDTGLPVIDDEKCVACAACAKACPRLLIELRNKGVKNRRVFVACHNTEKGAMAKKNCSVACIGCGKCAKVCTFDAITIENNLAYIDYQKCKLCRKCVSECPTQAIQEVNFPKKQVAQESHTL